MHLIWFNIFKKKKGTLESVSEDAELSSLITHFSIQGFLTCGPSVDGRHLFLFSCSELYLTSLLDTLMTGGSVWITMLAAKNK